MVELCGDRTVAEARKKHIKELAPSVDWQSRIIEDVSTASIFVTQGVSPESTTQLKGRAEADELGLSRGVVLIMWAE
tara:strand:+ start:351 stop:581 length:231 start_codon:yes stop_codon:yes gene_type:complete